MIAIIDTASITRLASAADSTSIAALPTPLYALLIKQNNIMRGTCTLGIVALVLLLLDGPRMAGAFTIGIAQRGGAPFRTNGARRTTSRSLRPPSALAVKEKTQAEGAAKDTNISSNSKKPDDEAPADEEFVDSIREAALQAGSDFKDVALKVGGDLFVALRWGAANALTKSLPEDERDELLQRISQEKPPQLAAAASDQDGDDDDDDYLIDEMIMKNSVNEAVAAALAEESQREEARWEREKEQLLSQAEEAAQKRVESDLAVQRQRMEQEKRQLQEEAQAALQQLEREREEVLKEKEEEQMKLKKELEEKEKALQAKLQLDASLPINNVTSVDEMANTTGDNVHPILGPPLVDLGYKRVHTVRADLLASIPVWKKQRIYRHNRAKAMAADKLKTLHLGLPGVICLHEEENGKLSILDGQHRVGMMSILQEKQREQQQQKGNTTGIVNEFLDLEHVLVEVYPQTPEIRNIDHAQDIFLEINKAEPVRIIDMPGVATKKDRSIISDAVNRLEAQYPAMFSPSQRCRAPNLNIDNLRDNIFAANIIKRHNLKTAKQMLDWMLQQNKDLEAKLQDDDTAQAMFNTGAWKKASTNKFYLGLESSWLYN